MGYIKTAVGEKGRFVASVFEAPRHVAVLHIGKLEKGVTFGQNSWRGDVYEHELREAIASWEAARDAKWKAEHLSEEPRVL